LTFFSPLGKLAGRAIYFIYVTFYLKNIFYGLVVTAGMEAVLLRQQAWLMKAIVIELRVTSLNRQRSHTERLMALLLDDSYHLPSSAGNLLDCITSTRARCKLLLQMSHVAWSLCLCRSQP